MEEMVTILNALTNNSDIGDIGVFVIIAYSLFKGHVIPQSTHDREIELVTRISLESATKAGTAAGEAMGKEIRQTILDDVEVLIERKLVEHDTRDRGRL